MTSRCKKSNVRRGKVYYSTRCKCKGFKGLCVPRGTYKRHHCPVRFVYKQVGRTLYQKKVTRWNHGGTWKVYRSKP